MTRTLLGGAGALAVLLAMTPAGRAQQTWNFTGMTPEQFRSVPPGGPAPRRDISGIWTDGRALPPNPDPRWYGYSVGRWEDDRTLVVETIAIDDPKVYTKPWLVRNRMPLRLLPPGTDLMEMIPSASEAQAYQRAVVSRLREQ